MVTFWNVINKVIREADIILEVLDARSIDKTRNVEIEDKVRDSGKTLIYVMNKCDLVDVDEVKERKKELKPSVFISAKDHLGTKMLREAILKHADKKEIKVGVLGYPNTGKSSLINALKGRASAKASAESGYTKGLQNVRISKRILLLDTPGVIPYKEKDEIKHGSTGSVDYSQVKDPEEVVFSLFGEHPGIVDFYDVDGDDEEEMLENIALKFRYLKKGGVADTKKAARMILKDWQRGNIVLKE
ncbi:MAG: GTPase [Nanoarchaeota archaeon]